MTRGLSGRRLAELGGWIAASTVGTVMVSQAFGYDRSGIVSTLQALTPYGIPIVGLASGIALWQRSAALGATAACVGLAALGLASPIAFPSAQPATRPGAEGMRVVAANLLYSNPSVRLVAEDLAQLDPDVIVFSEFTWEHQATLVDEGLAARYPHQMNRGGNEAGGMALWSKFDLDRAARTSPDGRTIEATLEGPDGPVTILGVHPTTPIHDNEQWSRRLRDLSRSARRVDGPMLIIGDFNASYWHPGFRDVLRRGFTDAHIAHGRGWSPSWPTDQIVPPFVRLDHALTGNGLVSTAIDDFRIVGSDHAGLIVTVKPAAN